MARKTVEVQITDEGRDQGKVYLITEMTAFDTEKWAMRAINAIIRNSDFQQLKMILPIFYSYLDRLNGKSQVSSDQIELLQQEAGLDNINIESATQALALNLANMFFNLPYDELCMVADPLLDCCQHFIDYTNKMTDYVKNNQRYCEEPATIFTLRKKAFLLHTDFFIQAVMQNIHRLTAITQSQSKL